MIEYKHTQICNFNRRKFDKKKELSFRKALEMGEPLKNGLRWGPKKETHLGTRFDE